MKLFFDFLPILLFFIAFKLYGIYVATAVAMAASLLQVSIFWLKHHRVEPTHMITLAIIMVLGGATLLFHDIMFIKWKPTAIYWIFASLFLITRFVGNKTLIQRMMDGKISLPEHMWHKLNLSWALFFLSMGFINLYVVYHYNTNTWVNFKLFGTLGLTVVFVVLQSMYMAKGIKKI
ncbi:MAG: septation protein A [Gammaproteobacteria bacterium]|nr:septation protein A [Gammaproteobacteria bacterium]